MYDELYSQWLRNVLKNSLGRSERNDIPFKGPNIHIPGSHPWAMWTVPRGVAQHRSSWSHKSWSRCPAEGSEWEKQGLSMWLMMEVNQAQTATADAGAVITVAVPADSWRLAPVGSVTCSDGTWDVSSSEVRRWYLVFTEATSCRVVSWSPAACRRSHEK